jgi:alpha-glucosidase
MLAVMRFWLDRGVDGFRIDVLWHIIKDLAWRDNPVNPDYREQMGSYEQLLPVYSTDQPEVHDIVISMRKVLDAYPDRMMIGEIYLPISKLVTYYGTNNTGVQLPFNFLLISLPWDAVQIAAAIDQYEGALPAQAWPNWVLGNHDQPRIASRIGQQQARVAAILLLTLRGTPTLYYGDEIGMRDTPIPAEEVKDPQGLNMPGKNLSRDPARTPMQWDGSPNAGFTKGMPWLRLDGLFRRENVETQDKDGYSVLRLYRRLILLRQGEPSLMRGHYRPVWSDHQMIAYTRQTEGHSSFLVVLNLTHRPCYFRPVHFHFSGRVVLDSYPEMEGQVLHDLINLNGDEGLIVLLDD